MTYHYPQINGYPVLDPGPLCQAANRDGQSVEFWGRANSITVPLGMQPGFCYLVVPRATWAGLDVNGFHTVNWRHQFGTGAEQTLTADQLTLVRATAIGGDYDSSAAYFLELADRRWHLARHGGVVNLAYNQTMLFPERETGTKIYWGDSTDSGAPYTWQGMLAELWTYLPADLAGSCPTLGWYPDHPPENWRFSGVSAWEAIGRVLDACQSTLAMRLSNFECVALGDDHSGLSDLVSQNVGRLLLDLKPSQGLSLADVPETIRVLFPCWTRGAPTDSMLYRQGDRCPAHAIDEATGDADAHGGTELAVWSDLCVELDTAGDPLNSSQLGTSAAAIATRVTSRMQLCGNAMRRHYAGIVPNFATGPLLHQIRYRDYGDSSGLQTEISTIPEWSRPGQCSPGSRLPVPRDIAALTPTQAYDQQDGIPARSWTTLTGAWCPVYLPDRGATATERTLQPVLDVAGDHVRQLIFNPSNGDVGGGKIIFVGLTEDGTWYVIVEPCNEEGYY